MNVFYCESKIDGEMFLLYEMGVIGFFFFVLILFYFNGVLLGYYYVL